MKTLKYLKTVLSVSLLAGMMIYGSASAQEYDDMYFNKNDRKTVKVKKSNANVQREAINKNYNKITSSTENVSSRNINPEYIARYKNIEPEQTADTTSSEYQGDDYYVENYNIKEGSGMVSTEEYLTSKKYDREYTSQTRTNSSFGGFHPSISFGMGFGYSPYGMGFYPGMGMSYSMAMSWGMGGGFYDPWMMDPWMFSPTMSFYDQYMMSRYYRPWRYPFYGGYPYGGFYPYGGLSMSMGMGMGFGLGMGMNLGFGGYYGGGYGNPYYNPYGYYPGSELTNVKYERRPSGRSTTSGVYIPREASPSRVADNTRSVRIPSTNTSTNSGTNARMARDYSRTENEYYNNTRTRNKSSQQRISSSAANRYNYRASSAARGTRGASTGASYSSINSNRPVRGANGYSNGNSRYLDSGSRSSGNRSMRLSNGSYKSSGSSYSPTRSYGGSSYSGGSSSFSGGGIPSSSGSGRSSGGSRSRH